MGPRPPELDFFGISELAHICEISLKTATRWKNSQSVPPQTALMVLRRDLGCFHSAWAGWHISSRGELCSPENWIATPGDVLAMQFHHSQLAAFRDQIRDLRAQLKVEELAQFEEQPLPTQWTIALKG
jgi:hypothetical protein